MEEQFSTKIEQLLMRRSKINYQLYKVTQMQACIYKQHTELQRLQLKIEKKIKKLNKKVFETTTSTIS